MFASVHNQVIAHAPSLGMEATGNLPRLLTPTVLWTGRCSGFLYKGIPTHGHLSAFAIKGEHSNMLIDTGLVAHFPFVSKDVKTFLEDGPLDYIFPTHAEMPHCGALPTWMREYPNAVAVGYVSDYELYYPQITPRLKPMEVGESIDLGGRRILLLPAIWKDLPSLWAFDTKDRILFVSDGFAFLHFHTTDQCDHRTSEHPLPDLEIVRYFNERALQWTQYVDTRVTFDDIDRLLRDLRPNLIASAHGGVIDTPEQMIPLIKQGMLLG